MKKKTIKRIGTILFGVLALLCSGKQSINDEKNISEVLEKPTIFQKADTDEDYISEKIEELETFFSSGNGGGQFIDDVEYLVDEAINKIEEFDFPLSAGDKNDIEEIIALYKDTMTKLAPKYTEIKTFFETGNLGVPFIAEAIYLSNMAKAKIKIITLPIDAADLNTIDEMIVDYKDALQVVGPLFKDIDVFMKSQNNYRDRGLYPIAESGRTQIMTYDFPFSPQDIEEMTVISFHIRNDVQMENSRISIEGQAITGWQTAVVNQLYLDYVNLLNSWKTLPEYKYDTETTEIAAKIVIHEKLYSDAIFLQSQRDIFLTIITDNDSEAVTALIEDALAQIEAFAKSVNYVFKGTDRQELGFLTAKLLVEVRNIRNAEKAREFFMYLLGVVVVLQIGFFTYSVIKLYGKKKQLVKTSSVIPLAFLVAMPKGPAMAIIYTEITLMVLLIIATWVIYYLKAPKSAVRKNERNKTIIIDKQ